jgi:hypothetical protein
MSSSSKVSKEEPDRGQRYNLAQLAWQTPAHSKKVKLCKVREVSLTKERNRMRNRGVRSSKIRFLDQARGKG